MATRSRRSRDGDQRRRDAWYASQVPAAQQPAPDRTRSPIRAPAAPGVRPGAAPFKSQALRAYRAVRSAETPQGRGRNEHASQAPDPVTLRPARPRDETASDRYPRAAINPSRIEARAKRAAFAESRRASASPAAAVVSSSRAMTDQDRTRLQSKGVAVASSASCRQEHRPVSNRGNGSSRSYVPWCKKGV